MPIALSSTDFLTILNILVAFLGVLFVALTVYEFFSLRKLRSDFTKFRADLASEHYKYQQAAHRVIASYGLKDPQARIALLSQALDFDPSVYNGFNSIGYAYIELHDYLKAADAFQKAVQLHPDDKAGYCDLAYAYHLLNDVVLRQKYLEKAVQVDPSAEADIANDPRFT